MHHPNVQHIKHFEAVVSLEISATFEAAIYLQSVLQYPQLLQTLVHILGATRFQIVGNRIPHQGQNLILLRKKKANKEEECSSSYRFETVYAGPNV
jgi:hypothetical protein